MAEALGDPLISASVPVAQGRLALLEGDAAAALRQFEHAERLTRGGRLVALEMSALTGIGQAYLALGKPRAGYSRSSLGT